MPRLKDYEILAPFSADELIQNANALLRHIPEAQLQKRTLRFYSSQGLLPPPEGPRSKAQYRYEHLVILVALRLFKQLGLKLDLIEEVIRNQRAEGVGKLAETVQQYLDKVQRTLHYSSAEEEPMHLLALEGFVACEIPSFLRAPRAESRLLLSERAPYPDVKKTMRVQLTPDITLEFPEDKPLPNALQEACQKLKELLNQTP